MTISEILEYFILGTKVGKVLIMEDAELKTSVDIISLIDSSSLSVSSISEADSSADNKHGCKTPEQREISSLISFKGGFICSLASGRAVVVDTVFNKDTEDVRLKVSQIIRYYFLYEYFLPNFHKKNLL